MTQYVYTLENNKTSNIELAFNQFALPEGHVIKY